MRGKSTSPNVSVVALERMWAKIDRSGGPDACWPFIGARAGKGYGTMRLPANGARGRMVRVARLLLAIKLGRTIEPDEITRHTCDNPPCCNPTHLIVGTVADNSRDAAERGKLSTKGYANLRCLFGECHPFAKLTEAAVRDIRARYAQGGVSQKRLAQEYGVAQPQIQKVLSGQRWRHVS